MLKFLNENWKQIAQEFGSPMVDLTAKRIFKNIINYLEVLPIEEITDA